MTAGDLIREALANGESKLGLAKRLAGSANDADAEVKRWRYVVKRAADGGEPGRENASRIAAFFGVPESDLQPGSTGRARAEADIAHLTVALEAARLAHTELVERVAALEQLVAATPRRATRRGPRER